MVDNLFQNMYLPVPSLVHHMIANHNIHRYTQNNKAVLATFFGYLKSNKGLWHDKTWCMSGVLIMLSAAFYVLV